jgi:uncharacterized delta-60 repeat protein
MTKKHFYQLCMCISLGILVAIPAAVFAAGYLDTSFGAPNRYVQINAYSGSSTIQRDGRILMLGAATDQPDYQLMRFSKDGVPDAAFGINGSITLPSDLSTIVAETPDGKIIVAGRCDIINEYGWPENGVHLQRLLSNGQPDPSFHGGNPVCQSVNAENNAFFVSKLLVQPDGKILVLACDLFGGDAIYGRYILSRYTSNGSLDTGFGTGGIFVAQAPDFAYGHSLGIDNMVAQTDGKILLIGTVSNWRNPSEMPVFLTLIRLTNLGHYDMSFNQDGIFIYENSSSLIDGCNGAVQRNGRIVIEGNESSSDTTTYFLLGLTNGGEVDASFGNAGKTLLPERTCELLILPDDSLLTGSNAELNLPGIVIRRFYANGVVKPSFGTATYDFLGFIDDLSLQPGGQVILTSSLYADTDSQVFLARIGPVFADVPYTHPYHDDIEILYTNGLTGGCNTIPLKFCPDQVMNRGESAVFMLRAKFGSSFVPGPATHAFKDDWTKGTWAEPWADSMYTNGLSAGCSSSPLKYCPWDQIPREQAVIFALRMKYGTDYIPPAATGTLFADMTNAQYYATPWAEQAYKDGLIPNCGTSGGKPKICPNAFVSRGLGAYMIVRAKNLTNP